jgi:outer membrane protein TolC
MPKTINKTLILSALLFLTGCASFSPDAGLEQAQRTAQQHLKQELVWVRTSEQSQQRDQQVDALLKQTLSVDQAVQIALMNNAGLQAAFEELRQVEAEVVQAGRLPNPGFSFAKLKRGDEIEWERGLHFNLTRWLTIPWVSRLETRRFEQAQRDLALSVLRLATETRQAYFRAVAAEETARYMRQVREVAEASAELARRMAQTGNFSRLSQAREQAFYAEAALNQARAEQQRLQTREQLIRLLGLWGTQTQFQLPERLPDLPGTAREQPDVEQLAMQQRLDLQSMKQQTEVLAGYMGLSRTTRFINVLEVGYAYNSSNEALKKRGWEVSFELPLFDFGQARVQKAEAVYWQAVHRLHEQAVNARSEVREAYLNYRSQYDIAKHYRDEIVPLRKQIAEENLLRYNGMLIGVFDLLAETRMQIMSVSSAIEALRDFWLAESQLQMALLGKPGSLGVMAPSTAPVANDEKGH